MCFGIFMYNYISLFYLFQYTLETFGEGRSTSWAFVPYSGKIYYPTCVQVQKDFPSMSMK
jgi:hypothetical protein